MARPQSSGVDMKQVESKQTIFSSLDTDQLVHND